MLDGVTPPERGATCDAARDRAQRRVGRKHRVNGTPAMVFEDGTRMPGALPTAQIEKQLAGAGKQ